MSSDFEKNFGREFSKERKIKRQIIDPKNWGKG